MPKRPPKHKPLYSGNSTDETQRKASFDRNRKHAAGRGYNWRWQKARKVFLSQNPLCIKCKLDKGRIVPATDVDHITPHRGDMDLFWDQDNWQPLCKSCHSTKTAQETGFYE